MFSRHLFEKTGGEKGSISLFGLLHLQHSSFNVQGFRAYLFTGVVKIRLQIKWVWDSDRKTNIFRYVKKQLKNTIILIQQH